MDLVLYSHIEYKDLWKPFVGEWNKFSTISVENKYAFSNEVDSSLSDFVHIKYDDSQPYTNRLLSCLNKIDSEIILFTHEDMILCGEVQKKYILEALEAIGDVDFVKLLKGGTPKDTVVDITYKQSDVLKYCRHSFDYFFAIQPTIWKREKLIELLENNKGKSIWELEETGQEHCRASKYKGLYMYHQLDRQRGMFHWDSTAYPYIATAVHKGKWVTSEYPNELDCIFSNYNIDYSIRGTV